MLGFIKRIAFLCLLFPLFTSASIANEQIRVALDDLPGVDMLPVLIAIERAKEQGVDIKVSYMQSEGMAMRSILNQQADIGMGTPYKRIQETEAPIRMFFQLSKIRFHPVVDTRHYSSWKELDGVVMYSHGAGSGTEALVNMLAKQNNIQYSKMVYIPGSGVRANAMMNGRIHATVVDTERKNKLLSLPNSSFRVLPMPKIEASDEALYAHEEFIRDHKQELTILVKELLGVWQAMINNPVYVSQQQSYYQLLPNITAGQVDSYFAEMVEEDTFSSDGGRGSAFSSDVEFYGFAGTLKEPEKQLETGYWDFSIIESIR